MRQVLVDTARSRAAEKRGPGREVALADIPDWSLKSSKSLLAIDEALQRLEKTDPLKGQLIEMRYFGGMTAEESALASFHTRPHRETRAPLGASLASTRDRRREFAYEH